MLTIISNIPTNQSILFNTTTQSIEGQKVNLNDVIPDDYYILFGSSTKFWIPSRIPTLPKQQYVDVMGYSFSECNAGEHILIPPFKWDGILIKKRFFFDIISYNEKKLHGDRSDDEVLMAYSNLFSKLVLKISCTDGRKLLPWEQIEMVIEKEPHYSKPLDDYQTLPEVWKIDQYL